jgi:hypothetical protein
MAKETTMSTKRAFLVVIWFRKTIWNWRFSDGFGIQNTEGWYEREQPNVVFLLEESWQRFC